VGQHDRPLVSVVLLCPGQGTQRVGMGKDLAARYGAAREVFEAADDALGIALSRIAWEGPEAELTQTHNAQPAILTHTLAAYAVLRAHLQPVAAAGHSLGEYSAYAAAGALGLADAVRLVRCRGELMHRAGEQRRGTMAAVLGLETADVALACQWASTEEEVAVPANLNAPDQTVISGDPGAVERAGARCKELGAKRVVALAVSGAFHSPLMEPAKTELLGVLERTAMTDPAFPVIANVNAQPVRDAATARRLLGEQLTRPVRWVDSLRQLLAMAGPDTMFLELGPGTVLAGLLKRIAPEARVASVGTAEGVERLLEQIA
jgi:[acyl-carrier-protein] S-malonyltransferase